MKIQETVRAWRLRHQWKQREAAEKLGMPLSTYKQREQGVRPVKEAMIVAMNGLDVQYPTT